MPARRSPDAVLRDAAVTRRRLIVGLGVGALSLAACSTPPAPTTAPQAGTAPPAATPASAGAGAATAQPTMAPAKPAATQAPAKAQSLIPWRYAETNLNFNAAFRHMAQEKGFDREAGLDLQISQIGAGTTILKGLVAGEFDVVELGTSPVTPSIEKGAEIKLLGSFAPKLTYSLYVKQEINSVNDLPGKTAGAAAPGSLVDQLTKLLLLDSGLDPNSVTMVNIGNTPEVFRAVAVGKIDFGISGIEFLPELPKYPNIKSLFYMTERLPDYPLTAVVTTDKVIREQREPLTNFLLAHARGYRYALANRDETVDLASRLTGESRSASEFSYDWYIENRIFDPNFDLPESMLNYLQNACVRLGEQSKVLPTAQVADLSIRRDVLAKIGQA